MKEKLIRRVKTKKEGITLIALMITIIVLLILAAVILNLTLGEKGIFRVAKEAGKNYMEASKEEEENLSKLLEEIESEIEQKEEITSVYAKLYTRNDNSGEEVLVLASRNDIFPDYSGELTIKKDIGSLYKKVTIEDLYNHPEYEEFLKSEEWKKIEEEKPEEAKKILENLIRNLSIGEMPPWMNEGGIGSVSSKYSNTNLYEVRIIDEIYPISTANWFEQTSIRKIEGIKNLNTSKVRDMRFMFSNCELENLDFSNFNTSNVIDMTYMFYDSKFTSLDLSSFNTSNVTDMGGMFRDCTNLTELDIRNFNTSNVTDMDLMFNNCTNLTELDIRNFNTSNVTGMSEMFEWCDKLTSLDIRNFNTSNVTDMSEMFKNCTNLTEILVGRNWKVPDRNSDMFRFCGVSGVTQVTE